MLVKHITRCMSNEAQIHIKIIKEKFSSSHLLIVFLSTYKIHHKVLLRLSTFGLQNILLLVFDTLDKEN